MFGGFAPNSESAEILSKALGNRTVLSGSISRGKNDPSQSLQMISRPLMSPDELKTLPKGQFILAKTGCCPMQTRLPLFLKWGIRFGEAYEVAEQAARPVTYADRFELRGFGGTDFRPVFAHVEELKKTGVFHNLKGLIYFTDGLGIYPKKRPDYDTAFVYVGSDWEVGEIPPWVIPIWLSE